MMHHSTPTRRQLTTIAGVLTLVGIAFLLWQGSVHGARKETSGKFTEELVYVQSEDGIPNGGAIFVPPKDSAKRIAVIWIHGWGVNFYQPTYVKIGRALAERGYTCIAGNTRMHDLGNVTWKGDKRIRGGGYWGVASEQVRDIAAWIDFAEARGFKQVILVGHSAGWAAVTQYQAEKQDRRVVGVVVASASVYPATGPTDPDQIAQATRMMAEGRPDDLVPRSQTLFSLIHQRGYDVGYHQFTSGIQRFFRNPDTNKKPGHHTHSVSAPRLFRHEG